MIDEAIAEETYTQTQISWDILKQSAINFLQAYQKLELLEKNQTNKQMTELFSFDGFKNTTSEKSAFLIKKNKIQFLKMKYLLAFNFDAKLTAFRGQLPKEAIFVMWDSKKQQTKSYKMSMNKLVELANEEGRLFLKVGDLKGEEISQIEKEDRNGLDKKHIDEAQSAYRVTNYGDVKEAYIAALMTKHIQNVDKLYGLGPGQPAYYDDLLIESFFNNYIHNVTNMAAIVEEDINFDWNSAQYAVKSAGASLPSLNQYLTTAKFISQQKTILEPKELSDYIRNELFPMDAKRNLILGHFNSLGQATTDKLISDLQRSALLQIRKKNKT